MKTVRVDAPSALTTKAQERSLPVNVLRAVTALPSAESGAIVMRPAVVLRYSVRIPESSEGAADAEEWFFEEVRFEDNDGRVDLTDTLWAKLKSEVPAIQVLELKRSGSL